MAKFKEEKIQFETHDGLFLKGTLTWPINADIIAPVLMMVGTGAADQDETTPAPLTTNNKEAKLFKQISDSLASQGFVTIRYNKRGIFQTSTGARRNYKVWNELSRDDLIKDGLSAAKFLIQRTNLSEKNLIILGHSEGTIIGTEVALKLNCQIKALALLGVVSRSMKELAYFQNVTSLISKKNSKKYLEKEFKKSLLDIFSITTGMLSGTKQPVKWLQQSLKAKPNRLILAKTNCPIGIFQGNIDPQTPIEDAYEIQKLYKKRVKLYEYEGLGHAFSKNKLGKPTLGPIEKKVLVDICDFCKSLFP